MLWNPGRPAVCLLTRCPVNTSESLLFSRFGAKQMNKVQSLVQRNICDGSGPVDKVIVSLGYTCELTLLIKQQIVPTRSNTAFEVQVKWLWIVFVDRSVFVHPHCRSSSRPVGRCCAAHTLSEEVFIRQLQAVGRTHTRVSCLKQGRTWPRHDLFKHTPNLLWVKTGSKGGGSRPDEGCNQSKQSSAQHQNEKLIR